MPAPGHDEFGLKPDTKSAAARSYHNTEFLLGVELGRLKDDNLLQRRSETQGRGRLATTESSRILNLAKVGIDAWRPKSRFLFNVTRWEPGRPTCT